MQIRVGAGRDLGAHVDGGAFDPVFGRLGPLHLGPVRGRDGEPEVDDLDAPIRREDGVGRLQVAVHDATRVQRRHALGELFEDAQRHLGRGTFTHDAVERRALDQLEHEEWPAPEIIVAVLADVVHGHDVRALGAGHRARLFAKAAAAVVHSRDGLTHGERVRGRRPFGAQDLDGDLSAELLVATFEDRAEAAFTQHALDAPALGDDRADLRQGGQRREVVGHQRLGRVVEAPVLDGDRVDHRRVVGHAVDGVTERVVPRVGRRGGRRVGRRGLRTHGDSSGVMSFSSSASW